MKRCLFLVCIFLSAGAFAETIDPFFPSHVGTVLEYEARDEKGKLISRTHYVVTEIVPEDSTYIVAYRVDHYAPSGEQEGEEECRARVSLRDGDVHLDPSSFINSMVEGARISGGSSMIPHDMEVGMKIDDFTLKTKIGLLNSLLNNTDIVVVREERATVPAGTFDCYVVESANRMKVLGVVVENRTLIWYTRGIGTVRTDIYDKKGNLQATQVLTALRVK